MALAQRLHLTRQESSSVAQVQRQDEQSQSSHTQLQNTTQLATTKAMSYAVSSQIRPQETTQQQIATQGNETEFEVEATAYSYTEPGLTPYTATGIDLRINPKVIAVDPSVIKLGSLVHVHGYGVYLAADTGGAIKGKRIDVHVGTVAEANHFGRRKVKITILKP
ncbi:3D domain-containing protein [Granulicatella sp. 19428wC4_WM01]|nr:3D domain-containing protein [Granulicatella sp. 19428wC4_WM01]TFU96049.1 hypothetical protein E4T68_02185 [Granulicatella sp. WM01]